jgi:hypothetical protein
MTHRGILACVVLLCAASAADAQRFRLGPVFRPSAPRVAPAGGTHIGVGYHSTSVNSGGTSDGSGGSDNWWSRWWWVVILAGAVLGVILLCVFIGWATEPDKPAVAPMVARNEPPMPVPPAAETVLVRIVTVPDGEAPEWVRQAWVGLVLPAVDQRMVRGQEVLSGRRSFAPAYQVSSTIALELLEVGNKTAVAEWWRRNTALGEVFLFDPKCCAVV